MLKFAAIDIGSNAIRLVVAEVSQAGRIKVLSKQRSAIRLGADVFSRGRISKKLMMECVTSIKSFKAVCDRHRVSQIRAVATSALREARNSDEFKRVIKARTGVSIDVITGIEEAQLINLAIAKTVDISDSLAVTIDMGGGSTEVNLVQNGAVIMSETHPIGAVRLLHLLRAEDSTATQFARMVRDYTRSLQGQLRSHLGKRKVDICVGTGGNFEALSDLRVTLLKLPRGNRLSLVELRRIIKTLRSVPVSERISKLGLRPDRADVIAPAAEVLAEIMISANVKDILIPRVGLREGVLYHMVARIRPVADREKRQQCYSFAQELIRIYQSDRRHCESVKNHALYLFDRLKTIHRLDSEARLLIELSALLHDIGRFVNTEDHHKHSMYLIRAASFIGLDREKQDIIACIARYHRGALPKKNHEVYRDLSPGNQRKVRLLAALLRIADAADRGKGRASKISIQIKKRNPYALLLHGRGDLSLERWSIDKKSDLFSKEYHRTLIVGVRDGTGR